MILVTEFLFLLCRVSRLCKDSKGLGTTESSFSNGAADLRAEIVCLIW